MSDRELIEFAAKAFNLPECGWMHETFTYVKNNKFTTWDPLNDDGDALRLAVKLRITIRLEDPAAAIAGWAENQYVPFTSDGNGPWFWKEWGRAIDPCAVTRRAIVCAAAQIGKEPPPEGRG